MKNHFVFKFIAVLLCAFLLMSAVGSGVGIVVLSHFDLYNRTADQGYEEALSQVQQDFSEALVFRFASMELGHCSSALIDDYYGDGPLYRSFRWGRYSYSIRDREGNVLVDVERNLPDAAHYEIPVESGRFLCLLSERNADSADPNQSPLGEEPTLETQPETTAATEAAETTEATVPATTEAAETTAAAEETTGETGAETAAAEETAPTPAATPAEETAAQETTVPETTAETVPETTEATVPETTEATVPETTAAAAPQDQPVVAADGSVTYAPSLRSDGKPYYTRDQMESAFTYRYYDYKTGTAREATLCFANTSDYIVDLYLAPDAMYDSQVWDFLRMVGPFRYNLILVLGASLLLFAGLGAYLVCAAGRKPRTELVAAGGLNRLSLDAYAVIAGVGILGAWKLVNIGYQVFQNTPMLQAVSACFCCFLGCLLLVGFLFALAAQIKTPEGFWWKNLLVIRILKGIHSGLLFLWKWLRGQCKKLQPRLQSLRGLLSKSISLLPVSWQWILGTGLTMVGLCICFASRKVLLVILGILLAVAATLYAGYCFGTLLEGVRRMRRGELRSKVEDKALVGSFRDFAQELNGLADVAGTAAEKHIKSERMKTELITNVSHDIKTPLTSIINYVDLMNMPHSPEEEEVYMEVLGRQSQRLKKLIDDLMEMSKASTGNLQTEITRVNANEAITQALGEFADKLAKADLVPVFHAAQEDVTMMADGRLVWRVLSNLLGNAVKYALPGTRVYLDLQELQEDVLISVKNVSREELNISGEELMERFVRGDESRNTEGSGLGLNIAKSLMEVQHGQLELLVDGDLFKVTLIFPKNEL